MYLNFSKKKKKFPKPKSQYFCFVFPFRQAFYTGRYRIHSLSKMKLFVTIINRFQRLTILTNSSISDFSGVLGQSVLWQVFFQSYLNLRRSIKSFWLTHLGNSCQLTFLSYLRSILMYFNFAVINLLYNLYYSFVKRN